MLRLIARRYAKAAYVFRQEVEAATNELNAGLAHRTSIEKLTLAAQLVNEASEMNARIKEMDEKLEKGFWECENGHEFDAPSPTKQEQDHILCAKCNGMARWMKRDQMTGQEKYESDRERKDAEDLANSKREQAKAEEENAANSEKTAKYMQTLAHHNRSVAEKVRRL